MKSLSLPTKMYLLLTYAAGIVLFLLHIGKVDFSNPWLLVALCILASLTLILKVEGSTNRSHYTFCFLVYGFTFAVFGSAEAILIIVVSNLVEWIWNKPAWYIQLFNTGSYVLVMWAAGLVYNAINLDQSLVTWQSALGIIFSMATFNLLNHLLVGIVVWLARGENLKQSGIFEFFPLMLDLTLLYFGASLSIVWNYNPYALALFAIPLYLIYSTLRVPALERQTEIDSKTGLFNHKYFKKHIENELARSNRFDRPLSVILADLDLLRNINNTYGHLAGDEVLIGMAKAMKDSVRDYDVVCRFGGEEFAILLPETTISQAYERAEIIRKAIENLEFTVPTSMTPICATMSFGIAHRENFSQTADEITHNADLALYHSKLSGRNRSYAYINDEYIDFQANEMEIYPSTMRAADLPKANSEPAIHKSTLDEKSIPDKVEMVVADTETNPVMVNASEKKPNTKGSKRAVNLFISVLALLSMGLFVGMLQWIPFAGDAAEFDWAGLIIISIMIILSESFSVDLYFQQTSVSTSAIPIVFAYLNFGPMGVLWVSLVLAISLVIKYRSPFNRFVFNLSNHVLVGVLILGIVSLTGNTFLGLTSTVQFGFCLVSAAVLYLTTTSMVSYGMSLDLNQPAFQIWKEQYSWLARYYLGIGFITYALVFGYEHDHITGLLLMVVPMVLLRINQKQHIDRTREIVTELREKNQILKKYSEEITELNEGLLLTLSEIIDLRDPYVLGHSKQVSEYASHIAKLMGLNEKQTDLIRKAGLLHDIGKLGIPIEILTKPGKLTRDEYEIVKEHATLGGELVKNSPSLRPLAQIIRHHHERYDGKGYPDQISGNQISIEARIIAVADAIEVMKSDRPYRRALTHDKVQEELLKGAGGQFDPLVVDATIKVLDQMNSNQPAQTTSRETRSGLSPKLATHLQAP